MAENDNKNGRLAPMTSEEFKIIPPENKNENNPKDNKDSGKKKGLFGLFRK